MESESASSPRGICIRFTVCSIPVHLFPVFSPSSLETSLSALLSEVPQAQQKSFGGKQRRGCKNVTAP